MQFHSCLAVLKRKKPIPKDFPPQKTKQKFAKIFDRARKGTENDAQKRLQFRHFVLHFLITQLTEVSLPYI